MRLYLLVIQLTLTTAKMLHAFHFQSVSSNVDLQAIAALSSLSNLDIHSTPTNKNTKLLTPLLKTRVSGTPGNKIARDHIIKTLESLKWQITLDTFTSQTPLGPIEFTNIIASRTPQAQRKLILSAHYDSKIFPFEFIGAVDSAVPCAILLDVVVTLNDLLEKADTKIGLYGNAYPGLELVFFDGEEAVKDWTDTDSLYGSRHLAALWQSQMVVPDGANTQSVAKLNTIDVMVLLDLLGMRGGKIPNSNHDTHWMWERLFNIETDLCISGLLQMKSLDDRIFLDRITASQVGDDHVPFKTRGMNI